MGTGKIVVREDAPIEYVQESDEDAHQNFRAPFTWNIRRNSNSLIVSSKMKGQCNSWKCLER